MSKIKKLVIPTAEATAAEPTRKDALKGSLEAVQATSELLNSGRFNGNQAHKVVVCLSYLKALENQIRSQIEIEK
jgi:hypothetical protein